jgi:hypothetical protein
MELHLAFLKWFGIINLSSDALNHAFPKDQHLPMGSCAFPSLKLEASAQFAPLAVLKFILPTSVLLQNDSSALPFCAGF